ncbi:MAG TPA: FHA domain-containing protein [Acetobacteraceae bacterium]|nr:FHA domain-containing protein [Acetobacteraceae bacterium]
MPLASPPSTPKADPAWSCQVISGPNAGAMVRLHPGRYRLGSALANDIVLADTSIAAEQAVIEISNNHAAIELLADGTSLGRRKLRGGSRRALKPRSELTLGASRLRLTAPQQGGRQPLMLALPLLIGVACVALGLAPAASKHPTPAPAAIQPRQVQIAAARPEAADDAIAALRVRLTADGLGAALHVEEEQGAVMVAGSILATDRERWQAEHAWFDGRFGADIALLDRVTFSTTQDLPRLDVRAVAMSPVPYVITASGDRYMAGAVLQGGWKITRIALNCVVLQRNGHEIDVTL